ncbi:aldehyde dehydrogenase family protein [Chondromyces apiculatus]|uniref:aldehyde dehydrogenase (NAD(+)) n=1 Tax=Chondromyces apiculatus DSM 436 TaxID=1192034 RepID=A0A017T763_9BACT|nr:aldehyde dehydrogenase family protein [Chondromyces apiculatus]EYF05078.1 Aldehyde dehydrogenase [Chondromyces apiculatus DSM 436]
MREIQQLYIDGAFVEPHGTETVEMINPATEEVIGRARLGDAEDTRRAIAAAKRAFPVFSRTGKEERLGMLRRLQEAVLARADDLREATLAEYGGPYARASWTARYAASAFQDAAETLAGYALSRSVGASTVVMDPVGVAALITPWNSSAGSLCSKLAMAVAAGCTCVIKPSEMSALQTQIVTEALHAAGLPEGVFNVVAGRGEEVGGALSESPDVAKISFTGSTATGKAILRAAAGTLKRVSLALGGKSPTILLEDADLAEAVPFSLQAAFQNNGQACIAGSRLLVPRARLAEVLARVREGVAAMKVGDPRDPATTLGPLASAAQVARVQRYIRLGLEEGATLVTGGEGRPEGLTRGYFVRPTVFADVRSEMAIAREEVFGPVLAILTYEGEEEAIQLANDSDFGLQAYVFSASVPRARAVAMRLQAGRVLVNGLHHDPLAPFGGFKQSGIGREFGVLGLESFLEPKAILGPGA